MGKIILVAESGSDITADLRERYGIRIVPMHVIFDDESREDGTFPPSEVIDYYRKTRKIPTTSGAMIYDFDKAFDEILAAHPDRCVRIPMVPGERSLNLSNAVAAALFEALRHTDYAGLEKYGELRRETWAELPKTDGSKDNDRRDGMSIYSQRAQAFRDRTDVHRNCAQAVLMTFAPELGLTEETAAKLCRHFGSGMKIGAACGAYTGGLMVLGLAGLGETEAAEEFTRAFEELEDGRLDCRDLLRVNTDRGGEKKPFCDHLIRACVLQLEEMLRHKGVIA